MNNGEEEWRSVKKLGSSFGNIEYVIRRMLLSNAAMARKIYQLRIVDTLLLQRDIFISLFNMFKNVTLNPM